MRFSLLFALILGLCGSANLQRGAASFQAVGNASAALALYYQAPSYVPYASLSESGLRHLAEHGVADASILLATLLVDEQDFHGARLYWQQALNPSNASAPHLWHNLADALMSHHQWQAIQEIGTRISLPERIELKQRMAAGQRIDTSASMHSTIDDFGISLSQAEAKSCPYNILLMADSLASLNKLQTIKQRYESQPEPSKGVMCLSIPYYVGGQVACAENEFGFSQCDWRTLAKDAGALPPGFDFIVMMSQSGLANVQAGVMHVSEQTQYHTFLHELLHFAGFTDEYLAPPHQQQYCLQKGRIFANLYVGDNPPKGWSESEYCANGRGFKPASEVSIMEHSESGLSEQYRQLWAEQLKQPKPILRFADWFYVISEDKSWQQYRRALDANSIL